MTKPKWEPLYCSVCGNPMGKKPGQGAVIGLLCGEPSCELTGSAGIEDARNAVLIASVVDGIPVQRVATAFHLTRQRVYQIYNGWVVGK